MRFANNHAATTGKSKKSRKALRRQGSFSSTSNTSATSSYALPTKAELVETLVEVAKEEPKVMDAIVDHLTLQDALATSAAPAADDGQVATEAQEEAAARHQRVASIVDPVALENIAYGVDCGMDDGALDELIDLLNHDDTILEEDIQDILDMAAEGSEVPPTIAINFGATTEPAQVSSSSHNHVDAALTSFRYDAPVAITSGVEADVAVSQAEFAAQHHSREFSDGLFSVMREPILDGDWR